MEKNNTDLFELMNDIYSEMQSMKSAINDMQCDITDIKPDKSVTASQISDIEKTLSESSILIEKIDNNIKLFKENHNTEK